MKQFGCEHILEFQLVASDYNLAVNKFLPFATSFEEKHTLMLYRTEFKNIPKFRERGEFSETSLASTPENTGRKLFIP